MAPYLSPGYLRKTPEDHPKKTYGKKGIKSQKTPNKLTRKTPKKNSPEDDHKTVLKSKSKNIKTAAKQRITRKKTPLEPGLSSTVKKNVLPGSSSEEDKLWDEAVASVELSFMLKPVQLPPDYDFHDHNKCIAAELGLDYGVPIPACFAKYFDDEAMVPLKAKPSCPSDSDSDPSDLLSWPTFKKKSSLGYIPYVNSPSPPSDDDLMLSDDDLNLSDDDLMPSYDDLMPPDGYLMGLDSNDALQGLVGPMTRSKTKKAMEEWLDKQIEEDSKWCQSIKEPTVRE